MPVSSAARSRGGQRPLVVDDGAQVLRRAVRGVQQRLQGGELLVRLLHAPRYDRSPTAGLILLAAAGSEKGDWSNLLMSRPVLCDYPGMATEQFTPVARQSVSDTVFAQLRDAILGGGYPPGTSCRPSASSRCRSRSTGTRSVRP